MNETKKDFWMTLISGYVLYMIGIFGTLHLFFNEFSLPHQSFVFIMIFVFSSLFLSLQSLFTAKRQLIIILLLLGVWLFFGYLFQETLLDGAVALGDYFAEDVPKIINYEISTPPPPTAASESDCARFIIYILFPFTGLLHWAVVIRKSVFFSVLLTVPFFAAVFFLRKLPSDFSIALLLSFWFVVLIRNRNIRRLNIINTYTTIGGFLLFLILIFSFLKFFPRDTYLPANEAFEKRDQITNYLMNLERSNPIDGMPGFTSGSPLTGPDTEVNLNSAGNMRFAERDVFRVYSNQPRDMYLRGYSAAQYENNAWKQLKNGVYEENSFQLNPLMFLADAEYAFSENIPIEISIDQFTMDSKFIFTPYLLVGVSSDPAIQFYRDSYITTQKSIQSYVATSYLNTEDAIAISPSNDNFFELWNETQLRAGVHEKEKRGEVNFNGNTLSYVSNSVQEPLFLDGSPELQKSAADFYNNPPPDVDTFDLFYPVDNRDTEYLKFLQEEYTDIPDELRQNLLNWWGTGEQNIPFWRWAETAKSVAQKIQSSGSYTLTPGTQPVNRDFIEYFLFERNQGYCVHFASATVATLRALGIPARYSEGYVLSKNGFDENGFAIVPANNAHAWAEIWVPDLGWIPVESTPGGAPPIATAQAEENALLAQLEEELQQQETTQATQITEFTIPPTNSSNDISTQPTAPSSSKSEEKETNEKNIQLQKALLTIALIVSIIGGICLSVFLVRYSFIKFRKKKFSNKNYDAAALYAYNYLERLMKFGTSISDDSIQIAQKARFSEKSVIESEIAVILNECEISRKEAQRFLNRWEKIKFWLHIL